MMKKSKETLLLKELLASGFYQVDELFVPIHLKILVNGHSNFTHFHIYFLDILQVPMLKTLIGQFYFGNTVKNASRSIDCSTGI